MELNLADCIACPATYAALPDQAHPRCPACHAEWQLVTTELAGHEDVLVWDAFREAWINDDAWGETAYIAGDAATAPHRLAAAYPLIDSTPGIHLHPEDLGHSQTVQIVRVIDDFGDVHYLKPADDAPATYGPRITMHAYSIELAWCDEAGCHPANQ